MDEVLSAIADAVSTLILAFADSEGIYLSLLYLLFYLSVICLLLTNTIEKNTLFADMVPAAEVINNAVGGMFSLGKDI